ncbi:MAG: hypothetical protein COT14_01550 [Candidatus Diapherotrites archaeon CG08_land_8_20_14_0_20_30_16]|nr:MAG: hypothetical protein COT14_01550 [Candidatus Diapherotrites archaeon CG08_land_8_20_14_0_20_30_16]
MNDNINNGNTKKMSYLDYIKAILIILILVFGLLFALTATKVVHCKTIGQFWCNVYWDLVESPRVLIVFGGDGLGNAEKLLTILQNRDIISLKTTTQVQNLAYVPTTSYLDKYNMVIVTQAKSMSSDQLLMFYEYAIKGNILVWTGDAGTSSMPNDKKLSDYNIENTNVWTRVNSDEKVVPFGELISAEYIDNFCNLVNCGSINTDFVGELLPDPDSPIAGGIKPRTSYLSGDFAIVKQINNSSTVVDLSVDYQSNLITKSKSDTKGLGNVFPIMIRSGLGKNIVYVAVPLEYLVDVNAPDHKFDASNTGMQYPGTIRRLFLEYFGA